MKELYIYGASGHGLVVADIARDNGYENIIFIDDGKNEYPTFEDIKDSNNIPIAFGIGNNIIRAKLYEKVKKEGFNLATLIHSSSIISSSVCIEEGTIVMPNVVINANSIIGKAVILNSSSVIEHECKIEDFVHISPNVALAGNVNIKELTHIGIGSCVIQGLTVGKNSLIGAGAVVVKNIKDNIKAYGNPCCEVEEL
ncbi:acetyltransferase [Halarcobacter bivalviorum]|uniref:Acetyltransferase n=1 Tax=Halarcobacter bivalviorum TaxID=663364 RepID=A0AAX2AB07_9BACT|nr:acetyltransferase [Halarcobacter bivalviorum]AXH11894.1 sugar O-acyltransferase [Halarcobacter bivalviorum]RXK11015.1 acetyltransferase [Halarcobacter bivalviorum]